MASNTTNYGWTKPDYEDDADIQIINATIEAIDAQMKSNEDNITDNREALAELIDSSAKNRLPFNDLAAIKAMNTGGTWDGNAYTWNGVTFTVNSDFSVTADGTATGDNAVLVLSRTGGFSIEEGSWILSGCPEGGSATTFNIAIAGTVSDTGNTAEFTAVMSKLVRIYVISGTTADGLIFKPMICSKAAWNISQAYQPNRPSYDEIIARITALENA